MLTIKQILHKYFNSAKIERYSMEMHDPENPKTRWWMVTHGYIRERKERIVIDKELEQKHGLQYMHVWEYTEIGKRYRDKWQKRYNELCDKLKAVPKTANDEEGKACKMLRSILENCPEQDFNNQYNELNNQERLAFERLTNIDW